MIGNIKTKTITFLSEDVAARSDIRRICFVFINPRLASNDEFLGYPNSISISHAAAPVANVKTNIYEGSK